MFREADISTLTSALGCKTRHIQTVEINIHEGSSYASPSFTVLVTSLAVGHKENTFILYNTPLNYNSICHTSKLQYHIQQYKASVTFDALTLRCS
jgi:hypothetical protein